MNEQVMWHSMNLFTSMDGKTPLVVGNAEFVKRMLNLKQNGWTVVAREEPSTEKEGHVAPPGLSARHSTEHVPPSIRHPQPATLPAKDPPFHESDDAL